MRRLRILQVDINRKLITRNMDKIVVFLQYECLIALYNIIMSKRGE